MQLTLGEQAELLRDEALAVVERGCEHWVRSVVNVIRAFERGREFTTDDLWAAWGVHEITEPRAMGAAIKQATKLALVKSTGAYRKSKRPECHARPIQIWRRQ